MSTQVKQLSASTRLQIVEALLLVRTVLISSISVPFRYVSFFLTYYPSLYGSKFGLRAIDRVGAAVLTQSRHWRRCTLRYRMYVALLLLRVVPPPVGIWLQPGSCAQYKFYFVRVASRLGG